MSSESDTGRFVRQAQDDEPTTSTHHDTQSSRLSLSLPQEPSNNPIVQQLGGTLEQSSTVFDGTVSDCKTRAADITTTVSSTVMRVLGKQLQNSINPIEDILFSLGEINKHTRAHRRHIQELSDRNEPLYNWAAYEGYENLNAAAKSLKSKANKLKRFRATPESIAAAFSEAMDLSASTSRAIADILATLNTKVEAYVLDLEDSPLAEETKTRANSVIVAEVQKLSEDSAVVAESVWAAVDLLQGVKDRAHNKSLPDPGRFWIFASIVMVIVFGAAVAIGTLHLQHDLAHSIVVHTQVVDLVERTHALNNITNQFYSLKMLDLDQRFDTLSSLIDSQGHRIDNIAESLGPPNEKGLYYVSSMQQEAKKRRDEKFSMQSEQQIKRLKEEMERLRKYMNRMDIRLTRGLDQAHKDK